MFGQVVGGTNGVSEGKSNPTNSEIKDEAGNACRSRNSSERDALQGLDTRSANTDTPDRLHMTQPAEAGEENETATISAEGAGNTGFSAAGGLSALSLQGSDYGGFSDTEQLQADLSSLLVELRRGRDDTSDEGKDKISLCIGNLKNIVNNALDLNMHNQVAELYPNACFIDNWLYEGKKDKELEESGVKFDPVKLPSVNTEDSVDISFYDYLHGLSRSGIMKCLEWCLNDLDSYLTGCDVRCDDTLLQGRAIQDGSLELVLVIHLYDLKAKEFSDIQFHLDGDSNNSALYFANMLDDHLLKPLFKKVQEAGGKVPEKIFSEYISDHV